METIREIRRRKGWSQADLARESGIGQDTISGIETGRHNPRPSTLRKIAQAFDVEVEDLFPKAEAPSPHNTRRSVGLTELLREHGLTQLATDQDTWERHVAVLDLEDAMDEYRELVREREDFRAIIRGSKWLGSSNPEERRQLNAQLRRRFMDRLNDVTEKYNDLIRERVAELSDEEAEALVETYSRQMEIALGGGHY